MHSRHRPTRSMSVSDAPQLYLKDPRIAGAAEDESELRQFKSNSPAAKRGAGVGTQAAASTSTFPSQVEPTNWFRSPSDGFAAPTRPRTRKRMRHSTTWSLRPPRKDGRRPAAAIPGTQSASAHEAETPTPPERMPSAGRQVCVCRARCRCRGSRTTTVISTPDRSRGSMRYAPPSSGRRRSGGAQPLLLPDLDTSG